MTFFGVKFWDLNKACEFRNLSFLCFSFRALWHQRGCTKSDFDRNGPARGVNCHAFDPTLGILCCCWQVWFVGEFNRSWLSGYKRLQSFWYVHTYCVISRFHSAVERASLIINLYIFGTSSFWLKMERKTYVNQTNAGGNNLGTWNLVQYPSRCALPVNISFRQCKLLSRSYFLIAAYT